MTNGQGLRTLLRLLFESKIHDSGKGYALCHLKPFRFDYRK